MRCYVLLTVMGCLMAQVVIHGATDQEKEANRRYDAALNIELRRPFKVQLTPRLDRDYFTVTAPGDGVLRLRQLKKSKTHDWLYPWWMVDAKKYIRGGEWDRSVKKGTKVVFGLRSARNAWNEAASDEVVSLQIDFEPELAKEPDDRYETALDIELEKPFKAQINPRLDRDFRTFTSSGRGFVTLKQSKKSKTHGYLYPWWMFDAKTTTRAGEWTLAVKPQQKVVLGLRSAQNEWNEAASKEEVELTVCFTEELSAHEPNDSWATAERVTLGKVFKLMVSPRLDRDYFTVTAPGDGVLRLRQLKKSKTHGWLPRWRVGSLCEKRGEGGVRTAECAECLERGGVR